MSNTSSIYPPDVDRGPRLEAAYWVWSSLAIILVTLRFYARIKIRGLGWDDWMMLATIILFLTTACFVTYVASIGGARHAFYLTPDQQLEAVKWSWISQPAAIVLFAPGKASVAILTLRFISGHMVWRRAILYWIIVTIFIVNSLGAIFTFVQCDPPRALWTPGLPAHCWKPTVQEHYNYFVAAYNIAADIVLALLPVTIISKLNLPRQRRIALCVLLGLGLLCAVFSAVKVPYLVDLTSRSDFTWSAYDIEMWTGAEAFVMIVCGNIPPLQPLWDKKISGARKVASYDRTPLKDITGASFSAGVRTKTTASNWAGTQTRASDDEMEAQSVPEISPGSTKGITATTTYNVTYGLEAV